MERRRRRLPFADERTEDVLLAAIGRDRVQEKLIPLARKDRALRRNLRAVAEYYTQPISFEELGRLLEPPVSHESARKYVYDGMKYIWQMSSDKTREDFPLNTVPIRKPLGVVFRIKTASEATVATARAVIEGKSYDQLRDEVGLTSEEMSTKRHFLKTWGVTVPYKHKSPEEYASIVKACSDPEGTEEEYKKYIPKLTTETARHIAASTDALIPLLEATSYCGYYFGPSTMKPARELLVAAGIALHFERPIKNRKGDIETQNLYYVPSIKLGEMLTTLLDEPTFDRFQQNPVSKFAGTEEEPSRYPKTHDFRRDNPNFRYTTHLLISLGLATRTRGALVPNEIFFNTPACRPTLYKYSKSIVYHPDQEDELIAFIENRRKEFGV